MGHFADHPLHWLRASSHNDVVPSVGGTRRRRLRRSGGRRPDGCSRWTRPLVPPLIAWGLCLTPPEQGGADVMAIKDDTVQGGPPQQPVHNGAQSGLLSVQEV